MEGYDNEAIAEKLSMARRTVKAHCNRLFLRFNIRDGIKRVKLVSLLYRSTLCKTQEEVQDLLPKKLELSASLPTDTKTLKSPNILEPPSMSLRTTFASSTISLGFGIALNSHCGIIPMKLNIRGE